MENGEWRMENEYSEIIITSQPSIFNSIKKEWKVENGEWKMNTHKIIIISQSSFFK